MPLDLKKPDPLYLQIAEDVISRIASGQMGVGDQLGSQQQMAREYGVSLMTIKKAMTHLSHLGWVYGRVGKGSFVAKRSAVPQVSAHRSIGIVLSNLRSAFFSLIVQAVEEAAYRSGYSILVANTTGQPEKEERQIHHFRKIGASGLIIASLRHVYHATPTIQMLRREGFPFVMVSYMDDPEIPFVGTDHEEGGYLAGRHLVRLGYQRIGYVNAERGHLVGELRKQGFFRALRESGREPDPRFLYRLRVHGVRDYFQAGIEFGQRFVRSSGQRPDALFMYNDPAALGFQKTVLEAGLRIPDDIAIVGFDNIEQCEYAALPLSTIQQPIARIGAKAFDVVLSRIEGRAHDIRTVFHPELIVRRSCGARNAGTIPAPIELTAQEL